MYILYSKKNSGEPPLVALQQEEALNYLHHKGGVGQVALTYRDEHEFNDGNNGVFHPVSG
tara:strand:+ start:329 stop:508 length:180 start_codon:yes stop_codon:yes gene_type:complete